MYAGVSCVKTALPSPLGFIDIQKSQNYFGYYDDSDVAIDDDDDDDDDKLHCDCVEVLDGTEITETTRQFLHSWQANRDAIKQRLENSSDVTGRSASISQSWY